MYANIGDGQNRAAASRVGRVATTATSSASPSTMLTFSGAMQTSRGVCETSVQTITAGSGQNLVEDDACNLTIR